MTTHKRATRRRPLIVAAGVLVVGWVPLAFALAAPIDHRMEAFGYIVMLHAGGRLDVYRGRLRLARWYDFAQGTGAWAVLATIPAGLLVVAASRVGRPRRSPDGDGRGFPLD